MQSKLPNKEIIHLYRYKITYERNGSKQKWIKLKSKDSGRNCLLIIDTKIKWLNLEKFPPFFLKEYHVYCLHQNFNEMKEKEIISIKKRKE